MFSTNLDILFVIVLYRIKLEQSATYQSLVNASREANFSIELIVYNNSPEHDVLPGTLSPLITITLIVDKENSGVSKAYNTAAAIAKETNKKWLLLLDQDTNFPPEMINKYIVSIAENPNEKLFAPIMYVRERRIISPCRFKFMRGFAIPDIEAGINSLANYSIINCGMLIDVKAFHENNGYNELIKLDFSDHDFIKRFKKSVTDQFVVVDVKVCHQLSTETKNSLISDQIRFGYYLAGAKNMSVGFTGRFLLTVNAGIRAAKLSYIHRDLSFFYKLLKQN